MTSFRRFLLCLFALALLPGASVQASTAMAMAHGHAATPAIATQAPSAGDSGTGCHERIPAQPEADAGHPPEPATDTAGHADCCDGMGDDAHDCGQSCACAAFATALAVGQPRLALPTDRRTWSTADRVGRIGSADGPPNRPPIG
jgi:hypothetical protein